MRACNEVLTILGLACFFVFCVSVKVKLSVSLLCLCALSGGTLNPTHTFTHLLFFSFDTTAQRKFFVPLFCVYLVHLER